MNIAQNSHRFAAEQALIACMLITTLWPMTSVAGEWSGNAGLELRAFVPEPLDPRQHGDFYSVYLQPEFYHDWDEGDQRFVFTPFLRFDQADPARTHFDLREFYWRKSFSSAELSIGLKKIYWGVTESAHLVDIINQTDAVENIDTEDKLGQPMLNLTLLRDWGTVDLFIMPWFRERTFAGPDGRLRIPVNIDKSGARYESSAEQQHLDVAVRWAHYFGDWDIGLAHFSGTGREPSFDLAMTPGGLVATPVYSQIEQSSIDVQLTKGSWLWKLEAINRTGQGPTFQALAGGFEYSMVGLMDSSVDLGLITEYLRDNRTTAVVSNKDIAAGFRLAFNDPQSTELLAFTGFDLDSSERFSTLEGSRRLGQSWKASVEARFFSNTQATSPLHALRKDDYFQLALEKYF